MYDVQEYDDGDQLNRSLLEGASRSINASSRSNDSGLGVDESPDTPHSDADNVHAAHPLATTNDEMFPSPLSSTHEAAVNDVYVPLDEVMSSSSTSPVLSPVMSPTDYVTVWTDSEGKTVLPLRSVDTHAQSTTHDAQHLAAPIVDTSCHGDRAGTLTKQNLMTGGILTVLCRDDEHASLPAASVATSTDTTQPRDRDEQSNAVLPVDSADSPYVGLLTLQHLQVSPSIEVLGDRLHSSESAV